MRRLTLTSQVIDAREVRHYFRDMDILCSGAAKRFSPEDIDPDGLKILREAGFVWDGRSLAFKRNSAGHPESLYYSMIDYGFLRDQKLVVNSTLNKSERAGQLLRLRILIRSMD